MGLGHDTPTSTLTVQLLPTKVMDNCPVAPVRTVRAAGVLINWCMN